MDFLTKRGYFCYGKRRDASPAIFRDKIFILLNFVEKGQHTMDELRDPGTLAEEMTAAELFNGTYSAVANSATLRQIWQEVYGDDYPSEADPFSFVTVTDLRRIASELHVAAGQTFVDLACGRGGPGLWVARQTGASIIGLDFSRVGIEHALQRAQELGLHDRAAFFVRDIAATGLPAASLDGAMSVDALWLVPDKAATVREVARILRPRGRFVFTTWDFAITPANWPPQINGHQSVLQEAGFEVETYEETPDWERRQRAVYAGILAARDALVKEVGTLAAGNLIAEAQEFPDLLSHARRILVVARKRL